MQAQIAASLRHLKEAAAHLADAAAAIADADKARRPTSTACCSSCGPKSSGLNRTASAQFGWARLCIFRLRPYQIAFWYYPDIK